MGLQTDIRKVFADYLDSYGSRYNMSVLCENNHRLRSAVTMAARTAGLTIEMRTVNGQLWVKNATVSRRLSDDKGYDGSYFDMNSADDLELALEAVELMSPWDNDPIYHVVNALSELMNELINKQKSTL